VIQARRELLGPIVGPARRRLIETQLEPANEATLPDCPHAGLGQRRAQLLDLLDERAGAGPCMLELRAVPRRRGEILNRDQLAPRIAASLDPVGVDQQLLTIPRPSPQVLERGRHRIEITGIDVEASTKMIGAAPIEMRMDG
jgi:hypothetical protein